MALTIGELVGYISFDTSGVDEGVNAAEARMRALGNDIAAAAGQAGEEAGSELGHAMAGHIVDAVAHVGEEAGQEVGDDIVSGVVDELRAGEAQIGAAGDAAGAEFGSGLEQGAEEGANDAADAGEGAFSKLKMAAVAAGVAAGAALMAGIGEALEQGQIQGRLGAQLGATPAEAQKYGHIAGNMYANAVTEDFQGAADAIKATMSAGLLPSGATEAQIQAISTKMSDLASTFELDLPQAANAVGQVMKNKLAPDAQTAIDVITRGMQVMGPRADDLADTFNEYSPIFRAMGLSAQQATGLLAQGMAAGARDTDTVADAIKEFSIRAIDGSTATADGFKALGLDAKAMATEFGKGGAHSAAAFQLTLDKLKQIKDPVAQQTAAVALFGTKAEDMRATLLSLDPKSAVSALGQVGGAADKVGESLRANAGTQIETFKRKMEEGFVQLIGAHVIPKLQGLIDKVQEFKNSPEFDKLVQFGHTAWEAITRLVVAFKDMASNLAPLGALVAQLAGGFLTLLANVPPDVLMGIATALGIIFLAVKTYTTYVTVAAAVTRMWAASQGILNAIMMLNPIGLVIAAIVALIAIFVIAYQHSDKFREIVQAAWDGIKSAVSATIDWLKDAFHWFEDLPGKMGEWWGKAKDAVIDKGGAMLLWIINLPNLIGQYLAGLGGKLWNWMSSAFGQMTDAVVKNVMGMINWLKNLPGMIVGIIADIGWRLFNAGQDLIRGLWDGIKSMGAWLKSTLINWAYNMIPGPILKALGIASPSKVMAKEVGRWIPAGVVQGIESGQGAVDAAMSGLVTPPAAPALGNTAQAQAPVVRIEFAGPQEMRALIRGIVQKNGGNVQQVFT